MDEIKVILQEDVDNVGARGEIVKVQAGYARNYLLPRNLAVEATAGNVKGIEAERAALLKKEARERVEAERQAVLMNDLHLNFERKAGEGGILFGSVTSMDMVDALKDRGFEIDRHRIHLREPIKQLGEFAVPIRLHREVTVEVRITITPGTAQDASQDQLEFDRYLNQIFDSHSQMQQSEDEIKRLKDETRRVLAELQPA